MLDGCVESSEYQDLRMYVEVSIMVHSSWQILLMKGVNYVKLRMCMSNEADQICNTAAQGQEDL